MDLAHAALLGLVQGITEFLPISSDGHLVVVGHFLGEELDGRNALGFDILLHCGSLLAILIGFWDVWTRLLVGAVRLQRDAWKTIVLLVLGTIPGVFAGLFLQDLVATELRTLTAAAIGFLVTAACLILGERIGRLRGEGSKRLGMVGALLIGVAQAAAILPGVSRSGLTVSMARAFGVGRSDALNFSFLLALPIISGAVSKTALDAFEGSVVFPPLPVSAAGFAASAVVSVLAILFLRRFVRGYSFAWFAWYLIPVALLLIGEDLGLREQLDADHAKEAVKTFGVAAVFFFALMEVVPPFSFISPGVVALVIAGSLAATPLGLLLFILAAVAASFLGNAVLYVLGRLAGPSLTKALRISDSDRARAEQIVTKFGSFAVIGGQFLGAFRPTVAFVAGMLRMHVAWFFGAALIGASAWGAAFVGIGYVVRENVAVVLSLIVGMGALTLLVVGILAIVQWLWVRKKRART